ncbi:unnamed protein product [Rangifer tarandus platyrhynchus]|uniref:Uncharacterized protein n=2 Tax=Rangifer tarandus platyrhynchus TaxID=3082113 RepID=A0ACB0EIB5_RANTA|nr:unnamed protein product [Rangifer tarandus platyrhynchus]CAI9700370.1 unnamed protein product [Rangifer tarandus platyrhynchus]
MRLFGCLGLRCITRDLRCGFGTRWVRRVDPAAVQSDRVDHCCFSVVEEDVKSSSLYIQGHNPSKRQNRTRPQLESPDRVTNTSSHLWVCLCALDQEARDHFHLDESLVTVFRSEDRSLHAEKSEGCSLHAELTSERLPVLQATGQGRRPVDGKASAGTGCRIPELGKWGPCSVIFPVDEDR